MIKVFLVEDEFVVREGIKKNINWAEHGYEFCGEASDGELALPMIQKLKPDIVITDIKMPFMDGLALSRLVKAEFPWIEIIILSGYEEFGYAKEGIKIGVAEYLSKPISGNDLLHEVDKLAEKITIKKKEREVQEKFKAEMAENVQQARKNLFQDLVNAEKPVPELLETARKLNMDLSALWYNVVLVKMKSLQHEQQEYSNSIVEIEEKLSQLDNSQNVLVFDRNLEGKALIFKADSHEELLVKQEENLNNLREIFSSYDNICFFGGIGKPVNRLRELPISYENASHAFAHRFLMEGNRFLDSKELEEGAYLVKEEFDIGNVDPKQIDREKVREFLKQGDLEEIKYFMDEFFKNIGGALNSIMFRQYLAMDTYFSVVEFVESLQLDRSQIEQLDMSSGILSGVESTENYIEKIINQGMVIRDKAASNRYRNVVDEVCGYIEENYAQEELSLNLLASHVNFSPNHLSMVFSQQTGQTFIKYLTDFRMNKAKELLRCTAKRSSEISIEVGYKDPHYFSYLFKKTQGMTPTQYRGGHDVE